MNWLDRWLWKGTMEGAALPLPTFMEIPSPERSDLLREASRILAEQGRLIEIAERLEERSAAGSGGGGAAEQKNLARQLLPALDALDRLVEFGNDGSIVDEGMRNWIRAVEGVSARLLKTLEKIGLTPMSCVGCPVDLNLHDVIATVRTNEYPDNTVVAEKQKGYYFQGKLLRDAKVVVGLSS